MAKREVCPGCSRHCALNNVRCKYGRKYSEKIEQKKAMQAGSGQKADAGRDRCKWEKHVEQGGLAWKLLWVARGSKRALRSKKLSEQELLAALSEAEQAQLHELLEKISGILG